jgi:hypothetical protein
VLYPKTQWIMLIYFSAFLVTVLRIHCGVFFLWARERIFLYLGLHFVSEVSKKRCAGGSLSITNPSAQFTALRHRRVVFWSGRCKKLLCCCSNEQSTRERSFNTVRSTVTSSWCTHITGADSTKQVAGGNLCNAACWNVWCDMPGSLNEAPVVSFLVQLTIRIYRWIARWKVINVQCFPFTWNWPNRPVLCLLYRMCNNTRLKHIRRERAMPSETTASPGPAAPVVEAGSTGDPSMETGESRAASQCTALDQFLSTVRLRLPNHYTLKSSIYSKVRFCFSIFFACLRNWLIFIKLCMNTWDCVEW